MGRVDTLGTFILTCNHTIGYRIPWPTKGQHVYCLRCRADVTIVMRVREFKIDCNECRYHRSFGADSHTARRRAIFHARERAHDVTIYQGDEVLETIAGHQDTVIFL